MKLSPRTLAIRHFPIEISRLLLIRRPHGKTDGSEVDHPQYIADLSRLTMLPQYSDLVRLQPSPIYSRQSDFRETRRLLTYPNGIPSKAPNE